MRQKQFGILMFLIGLTSQTQVRLVGSIAIAELFLFVACPFLLISNYGVLKREGVATYVWLIVMAMVGGILAALYNHAPFPYFIRGFAAQYAFLSSLVAFYLILRKDPMSFGWYLLGSAISFVICIFVFQQATEVYLYGGDHDGSGSTDSSAIIEGPIFWIGRLSGFVYWPVKALYLTMPTWASMGIVLFFAFFSILTTASGRSAALTGLFSAIMIYIGGKTAKSLGKLQKNIGMLVLVGVALALVFKTAYSITAANGILGEKAQRKYEEQTAGGKDMLHLVMGGRPQVFIGLYCAMQRPFIGYGAWAQDTEGLIQEWMAKYGTWEAYKQLIDLDRFYAKRGEIPQRMISSHSIIVGWWLWYGILGVPVWLYTFYLMYDILRRRIMYAPALFGVIGAFIPGMIWTILFSPFGGRVEWGFTIALFYIIINASKRPDLAWKLSEKNQEVRHAFSFHRRR